MGANAAIAIGKFVAGALTGSAAMFAEAGHSVADTVNQVFLLVGINLSDTEADEEHPHGYGKEPFFWSFMAAIFIFVAGAAFSLYEGTRTLLQEEDHHRTNFELLVAFGVLGAAVVFEIFSTAVAVRGARRSAAQKGWPVWKYLRESPDLTLKTVLFEDSAALLGLFLAMAGLGLSEITGNESWDAIASLCIGVVLAAVAFMLGVGARNLLLGAAAHHETIAAVRATIAQFPEVEAIVRLLTMQLGSHSVLVTGELAVRREMTTSGIEDLIRRLDERMATDVPEVTSTFWELRPTA
jgi:cation diffusion facilitator family transporter